MKIHYHVIEEGDYGKVASRGYYTQRADAEKEVDRLSLLFPGLHFYVYETNNKKEPTIVTI
jgi:hypothetical protein